MNTSKHPNEALAQLRNAYVEHLPERIRELEDLLEKIREKQDDEAGMYALHSLVHKISGSGTTFGLPELSAVCAGMETRMKARLDAKEAVTSEDLAAFTAEMATVKEIARKATMGPGESHPAEEEEEDAGETSTRKYILLADDAIFLRRRFAIALQKGGFRVKEAGNGEEVLEMARRHRPDLILMDVMMPVMNGLEATRRLRENQALKDVPVIMLTTKGTVNDVRTALSLGIDDYITKPAEPVLVLRRVRACLEGDSEPVRNDLLKGRVLLVDEAGGLREKTAAILRKAGFHVDEADNAEMAIKTVQHNRPDVILMGMVMPGMNGMEAIGHLRRIPGLTGVPIIMMTTEGAVEDVGKAKELGVEDFLTRPVEPELVLVRVATCLSRQRDAHPQAAEGTGASSTETKAEATEAETH